MPFSEAAKAWFVANPSAQKLKKVPRKQQDRVLLEEDDDGLEEFLRVGRRHSNNIDNTRKLAEHEVGLETTSDLFKTINWKTDEEVSTDSTNPTWIDKEPTLPVVPLSGGRKSVRPLPVYRNVPDDGIALIQSRDLVDRMRALSCDLRDMNQGRVWPIDTQESHTIKHQIRELEREGRVLLASSAQQVVGTTVPMNTEVISPANHSRGEVTTGTASITEVTHVGPRRSLQAEMIYVPIRRPLRLPLVPVAESVSMGAPKSFASESQIAQDAGDIESESKIPSDDFSWMRFEGQSTRLAGDTKCKDVGDEVCGADSPTLGKHAVLMVRGGDNIVAAGDIDISGNFDEEYFRLWKKAVDTFGA